MYKLILVAAVLCFVTGCSDNKTTETATGTNSVSTSESNVETNQGNSSTSSTDSLAGKKTYVNPVDGKTYETEEGFKEFTPDSDHVNPEAGSVQPARVVLLTEESKLTGIIDINTLANFIKAVDKIVIDKLKDSKESGEVILQVTLNDKTKPTIAISQKGTVSAEDLDKVLKAVQKFSDGQRTKKDSCVFQSIYSVNKKS